MYLRYFFWNFSGKQNDLQGFGNIRDGNAITGIPFIDNFLYGDQSKMPDSIHTKNKSYNRMYRPAVYPGDDRIWFFNTVGTEKILLSIFLLFFFTGMAIVIYLNQAGQQPRERDYAYVGSFYAFAIWIGLGVIWVKEMFEKYLKKDLMANYVAAGLCLLAVPVLMGTRNGMIMTEAKKHWPATWQRITWKAVRPMPCFFLSEIMILILYGMRRKWKAFVPMCV